MKLTKRQHRYIKALLRSRDMGSTLGLWLQARWKSWTVLAIFCSLAAFVFASFSLAICWVYFGLWLGCFLRDIGHFQAAKRMWPVTREIVDWKRVSELDEEQKKPPII
jgi:hypothetical protein